MSQGGAVVAEQVIPECVLPVPVVNQCSARQHQQVEQLPLTVLHALLAAHHRQKTIGRVQAA